MSNKKETSAQGSYTNVKPTDNSLTFDPVSESRTMKKGDAIAQCNFSIKGSVSFEKAIKSAIDFAIIRYRDAQVKNAKATDVSDKDWMETFDGKTIELDLDEILTANSRISDPLKKVSRLVGKSDNEKLIQRIMDTKGVTREVAEQALELFS